MSTSPASFYLCGGPQGAPDSRIPKARVQVLLAKWMSHIQRLAGLKVTGDIHILRHTFCSWLAMAGAPAKAL